MSTSVDQGLADWINTTARAEHRTRANLLEVLLTEARAAREQAAQRNSPPPPIPGQTTIPVPGTRP